MKIPDDMSSSHSLVAITLVDMKINQYISDTVSCLAFVSISEVHQRRNEILKTTMTNRERHELLTQRSQTVAGFFALKHAILRVLEELTHGDIKFFDHQLELTHSDNGAPQLVMLPKVSCSNKFHTNRLHISISHTHNTAYGIAVYTIGS